MEFSAAVNNWKIIEKDLTTQDTDRSFVAANYDDVSLENNDENSLCRYEF